MSGLPELLSLRSRANNRKMYKESTITDCYEELRGQESNLLSPGYEPGMIYRYPFHSLTVDSKGLEPFLLACKANVLANYH